MVTGTLLPQYPILLKKTGLSATTTDYRQIAKSMLGFLHLDVNLGFTIKALCL